MSGIPVSTVSVACRVDEVGLDARVDEVGFGGDRPVGVLGPDEGVAPGEPVRHRDGVGGCVGIDAAVGQLSAGAVGGGPGLGGVDVPPGAARGQPR